LDKPRPNKKKLWQDYCGKIIKKLLNHFATIILSSHIILSLICFVLVQQAFVLALPAKTQFLKETRAAFIDAYN
jgi:uncharacterized membrane protein YozB (DUF420 family)